MIILWCYRLPNNSEFTCGYGSKYANGKLGDPIKHLINDEVVNSLTFGEWMGDPFCYIDGTKIPYAIKTII